MFASNCIELGFDVKTLSEILGHSTVEITIPVFDGFSSKLKTKGYDIKVKKYRFNNSSYYNGSILHDSNNNHFDIPISIKSEYCVAIKCTSAQLIIEIE